MMYEMFAILFLRRQCHKIFKNFVSQKLPAIQYAASNKCFFVQIRVGPHTTIFMSRGSSVRGVHMPEKKHCCTWTSYEAKQSILNK